MMEQTLDCFCKGIESTQSQRPEEAIPDSYVRTRLNRIKVRFFALPYFEKTT